MPQVGHEDVGMPGTWVGVDLMARICVGHTKRKSSDGVGLIIDGSFTPVQHQAIGPVR